MGLLEDLKQFLNQHRRAPSGNWFTIDERDDPPLIQRFYRQLWEQQTVDEDELAASLYGEAHDRNSNAYKKLKQRAIEELAGRILLVGPHSSSFTSEQRGIYRAYREYVVAELLRARNFKSSAAYFHRRALKKARQYGISSVEMLCLEALSYYAGVQLADVRLFERYEREYRVVIRNVRAEQRVASSFVRLKMLSSATPQDREAKHLKALEFVAALDKQYAVSEFGPRYAFPYFTVKIEGAMAVSDHHRILRVADEAIAYFSQRDGRHVVPLSYFLMSKLLVYTVRRDYENGRAVYLQCLPLVDKVLTNWHKLSELAFYFYLHTGRYAQAARLYADFSTDNALQRMPPRFLERWLLFRAYLHYLSTAGVIEKGSWSDPVGKFRLQKFINSVPLHGKEKHGRNIPVFVLHVLFALQRRDFDLVDERMAAMTKYANRYLRRKENLRSHCFVKLLLLFPHHNYRHDAIRRHGKRWLAKLSANPIELVNQSYELELVPYEELFHISLASIR